MLHRCLLQDLFLTTYFITVLRKYKYMHMLYFLYAALNIQLRLNGIPDCSQYTLLSPTEKTNDVTNRLVQGVEDLCGCGFSTEYVSDTFLKCSDDGLPNHVIYRAVIAETDLATAVELVSYIEQWDANTQSLVVQSVQLGIDTTCPVVVADLLDSPECPEVTSAPTPSPDGSNSGVNGFIVGGAIAGVFFVLLIAAAVVIVVLLVSVMKHKKTGSLEIQTAFAK